MPTVMIKLLFISLCYCILLASETEYTLELKLDREELYLTESSSLTLLFTYSELEDYELPEIRVESAKVEELDSSDYKLADGKDVEEVHYKITPLQSGELQIGPFYTKLERLTANYTHLNNRSKYTQKLSIPSNRLLLHVKPIPDNLSAMGSYTLRAWTDKKSIKQGEVLTLTLELQGEGNIKNLDALQLDIPNTTSYLVMSSKSTQKHRYTKTFEILAENSYTIPSFSLEYFDKELGIKRVAKSDAIFIDMSTQKETTTLPMQTISQKKRLFIFLVISAILFVLALILFIKKKILKKRELFLSDALKKIKTQSMLYKKIVPYLREDTLLDSYIFSLEKPLDAKAFKKRRKEIIQRVQEIQNTSKVKYSHKYV